MGHLRELRTRLLLIGASVFVMSIAAYLLYPRFIDLIAGPYCDVTDQAASKCQLYTFGPLDAFALRLRIAGWGGLFLAAPFIFWQVWRFISPGLYRNERRYTAAFVGASTLLFALGAATAVYTLPKAIEFLVGVGGPRLGQLYDVGRYTTLVVGMMAAFGAGFLFPVILVALQLVGVLPTDKLGGWRRQAFFIIVLVAAFITPSGDPFSLAALAVPMYFFYEVSILIGRLAARRRRRSVPVS